MTLQEELKNLLNNKEDFLDHINRYNPMHIRWRKDRIKMIRDKIKSLEKK
jgi:hypothetical protein